MSLPVFRRFTISDIPGAPNWINTVFSPLNLFCEQTVSALNKNLTIGQNVQGQKYSTSFTTTATYVTGDFNDITFSYIGGGQPNCLLLGSITRNDGTLILTPVTITSWLLNINASPYQVSVRYIAGLDASTKYNATFVVL